MSQVLAWGMSAAFAVACAGRAQADGVDLAVQVSNGGPEGSNSAHAGHVAPDEPGAAREHFELGREHFDARLYRDAIHEFELAYALWPMAELLFNIGRAYEELGDAVSAASYFERYLRDSVDATDAALVRARIGRLERRLRAAEAHRRQGIRQGALRLGETSSGTRAWLDGREDQALGAGESVFVSPGDHRLRVQDSGYGPVPREALVQVRPGELTTALFGVAAASPELRDGATGPSALVITGAIISLACFAGAATMATLEGSHRGPTDRLSLGTDALLGTGLLTALVSTVVYFADAPAD